MNVSKYASEIEANDIVIWKWRGREQDIEIVHQSSHHTDGHTSINFKSGQYLSVHSKEILSVSIEN